MSKKKPDQVADNPNILPYASNVGAPVIKPKDLTSFKQEKLPLPLNSVAEVFVGCPMEV